LSRTALPRVLSRPHFKNRGHFSIFAGVPVSPRKSAAEKTEKPAEPAGPVWPADKVSRVPIDQLIPYARNARVHSDAQVAQLAASMREWGWTNPVLCAEDGTIIAGHGRVLAARQLGYATVPVMTAAGWTEAQKRAYVIADNKLAGNATWDSEILAVELDELRDVQFDVDLVGFSQQELNDLIGTPNMPFREVDESAADDVQLITCPHCQQTFPK
jgi:ParB-like chromosome segregation protein Spo0J